LEYTANGIVVDTVIVKITDNTLSTTCFDSVRIIIHECAPPPPMPKSISGTVYPEKFIKSLDKWV
jgi:hypothetical protein